MKSHRAFRDLSSILTSSPRWHALGYSLAPSTHLTSVYVRHASDGSSKRWFIRQANDPAKKLADFKGLKSRAGIKLLEIDKEYKIFKRGQTVVDLGYAPGSWTQVAVDRTAPRGRVLGVDIIPALPPTGASTIQGDFTSPLIQAEMRKFLSNPERGRPRKPLVFRDGEAAKQDVEEASQGYIERERMMAQEEEKRAKTGDMKIGVDSVDVVLSDMCEPWAIPTGLWRQSLGQPYRLMNTSGMPFRDHAGSMDLCIEALYFCIDVLKPHGAFVCKFYQGSEDTLLERSIGMVFNNVVRNKPKSSRPESKENYFIARDKKTKVDKKAIIAMWP